QLRLRATVQVDRVLLARFRKNAGTTLWRKPAFHDLLVRPHSHELKTANEILEHLHLLPQFAAATAGGFRRELERAILVPDREGIVEIVVKPTAGQDELPSFHSVVRVRGPLEASLVVADYFVQSEVHRDRIRRRGVAEIEDGYGRMGLLNLLG